MRVQDELYRPLASVALTCDGRPGHRCSRQLVEIWCEERPQRIEQVLLHPASGYHLEGEDDSVFVCGDDQCAAESRPVRHDVLVGLLAGLVDRGDKRFRVSASALPVRPL